jgi:hypothetical protein
MQKSQFLLIVTPLILLAASFLFSKTNAQTNLKNNDATFTSLKNQDNLPPSKVDYSEFLKLSNEVNEYRMKRLVDLKTFLRLSKKEGVIILDTRSKEAYDGKHIKGAIHLNFSDFTAEKLAKVIPSKATTILIYCNNNFLNDPKSFALKSAPLALNIPTFINLYGYGYKDIYELQSLVSINHPDMEFEGSLMK